MICVNELSSLKCNKKEVLNQLIIVLTPFAPHVCEELWETLGNTDSVCDAHWPAYNEEYLVENTVNYTISFNGKARFNMEFPADAASDVIQAHPGRSAGRRTLSQVGGRQVSSESHRRAEEDCERGSEINQ